MPPARFALALLVVVSALSGCSQRDDAEQSGTVEVAVTLSRPGGLGPSIDDAPQSGVHVTVTDGADGRWTETTNADGQARLNVPSPGEYEVDITGCPDAPQHATVAKGASVTVRFDCIAP